MIRNTMFSSTVNSLFGEDLLPISEEARKEFQDSFFKFDEDFEYGAELPHIFVRDWACCRRKLIERFVKVTKWLYQKSCTNEKSLLQCVYEAVDEANAPNYALLLLWATQANAIPATFWTIVFALSHAPVYQRLVDEVLAVFPEDRNLISEPATEDDIKKLSFTKRCVLESIRLTSPGIITRKVTQPLQLTSHIVPKGHYLMLSPYWWHRNEVFFPEPNQFLPDRWETSESDKSHFLDGFIAFGGGRFQCPGRWFALMEIQLVCAIIFQQFHLKLLDPVPSASTQHLVGTQAPTNRCRIRMKPRLDIKDDKVPIDLLT
jgi:24-hydroxycholesterol 7alpha-hydroxylase